MSKPEYKFEEDTVLHILKAYIDRTYTEHYSTGKVQATEFICDAGYGEGFCLGNIIKYAKRYGKKGGKNNDDLLKIMHYAIILMGSQVPPRVWPANDVTQPFQRDFSEQQQGGRLR